MYQNCLKRSWIGNIAVTTIFATMVAAATAAPYPDRPVKLVVSSAAGGGADMVARLFAERLTQELKQPVVVENKPGASGVVATTNVMRSPADGYTLLFAITTLTQLPAIQDGLPFDSRKDFTPISLIAKSRNVLMVHHSTGVKSVPELAKAVSASPQAYNYGSWGNGSTAHFMGEMFNIQAKTKATHVPYRGSGPMMADLLGGVISFAFSDSGAAQAHLDSDRVNVLAVTGGSRLPRLPDTPTMGELGFDGFDFGGWFGLLASEKTPKDIVETLRRASHAAGQDPAVRQKLLELSLEPVGSTGPEFEVFLERDLALWKTIADSAGIKAD